MVNSALLGAILVSNIQFRLKTFSCIGREDLDNRSRWRFVFSSGLAKAILLKDSMYNNA